MFREKYPAAWTFQKNSSLSATTVNQNLERSIFLEHAKEYPGVNVVALPQQMEEECALMTFMMKRYSSRRFCQQTIPLDVLTRILIAGYGVRSLICDANNEYIERTVPSAGGMYPLELYVLSIAIERLEPGIYHYLPYPGLLEQVRVETIAKDRLDLIFLEQEFLASAGAIIVATSVVERTMKKYLDRGFRYILLEAGHCFQNMNLMATANDVGSVNIGGFLDRELIELLEIDSEHEVPLYAMAIGMSESQ